MVCCLTLERPGWWSRAARMLGRKESTVRSDLRRGREKLKKLLKEAYDFEGTV